MSITSQALPAAGPLVFQCRSCKSILSDSTEFVCTLQAPDGARFVCLRGVTNVRVDHAATSTSAPHSVHFAVCCEACGTAVGRLYTQAPPSIAAALNLLCLDISRCSSYELGSAEVRAPGGQGGPPDAAAGPQQQQQLGGGSGGGYGSALQTAAAAAAAGGAAAPAAGAGGVDASLVLDLLQRVEHLEATLCTIQGMQVLHDNQLRGLAGYQGDAAAAAAAAAAEGAS